MAKIAILYALCLASGNRCVVANGQITEYVPEWGGINCMEPCDMTAYMVPIEYGVTAACGQDLPYNTTVYFVTHWGELVKRYCQDTGGAIDTYDIDVAMPPDDNGRYYSNDRGGWPTLWIMEVEDEEVNSIVPTNISGGVQQESGDRHRH